MFFLLCLVVSVIFSRDKLSGLGGLFNYAIAVMLFIFAASLEEKERNLILSTMILCAIVISLLAVYQYFFCLTDILSYLTKKGAASDFSVDYLGRKRVFFPFITPNLLGGWLAMIIPLVLVPKGKVLLFVLLFFALLLTKSLGALFALIMVMPLYFYLVNAEKPPTVILRSEATKGLKIRKLIFLTGMLVVFILVLLTRLSTQKQHLQPLFSTFMRLSYWQETFKIILAHPLTGIGVGNFNLAQSRYAHNSYLQFGAETGIIGLISFFWLIGTILRRGLENLKGSKNIALCVALICGSCVFLLHNLVDFTFFLPEVSFYWWVIAGLSL